MFLFFQLESISTSVVLFSSAKMFLFRAFFCVAYRIFSRVKQWKPPKSRKVYIYSAKTLILILQTTVTIILLHSSGPPSKTRNGFLYFKKGEPPFHWKEKRFFLLAMNVWPLLKTCVRSPLKSWMEIHIYIYIYICVFIYSFFRVIFWCF